MTQPTLHITKAHFVGVINALHQQYLKDKHCSETLGQLFNTEISGYYDNSLLINSIFSFLHEFFPKDDDGHCEIEHYCYCCCFGKVGDEYESPEGLYDRLLLNNIHIVDGLDTVISWENATKQSMEGQGFSSLHLIDEAGHFPNANISHELDNSKKYKRDRQQYVKPSPDETA